MLVFSILLWIVDLAVLNSPTFDSKLELEYCYDQEVHPTITLVNVCFREYDQIFKNFNHCMVQTIQIEAYIYFQWWEFFPMLVEWELMIFRHKAGVLN